MADNNKVDQKTLQSLMKAVAGQESGEEALTTALGQLTDPTLLQAAVTAGLYHPNMRSPVKAYAGLCSFYLGSRNRPEVIPAMRAAISAMDPNGALAPVLVNEDASQFANLPMSVLMDIGADPTELLPGSMWVGLGQVTPIGYRFFGEAPIEGVTEMLDRLVTEDRMPVTRVLPHAPAITLFDEMLEPLGKYDKDRALAVVDYLLSTDLPQSWQQAMGTAVDRAVQKFGLRFPEREMDTLAAYMASMSIMPEPDSWRRLMKIKNKEGYDIASKLSLFDGFSLTKSVLDQMIADGVHPDEVSADLNWHTDDKSDVIWRGTLLQAAVTQSNVALTELLLIHGADPRKSATISGVDMDCFDMVKQFSSAELTTLLDAWKAKQAIESVVARAKQSIAPGTA